MGFGLFCLFLPPRKDCVSGVDTMDDFEQISPLDKLQEFCCDLIQQRLVDCDYDDVRQIIDIMREVGLI